jgi:hypothetical protein
MGGLGKVSSKDVPIFPNSLRRKGFGADTWFIENFRRDRFS